MRIRTRLLLGFLLVLAPVLLLGLSSGLSFRHLSRSNELVSQALRRYQDVMAEYTRLTHLNDLTNRLLRNFLKLGYVSEMSEVHPLQVKVRQDLDELMDNLEREGMPLELKEMSHALRSSVDELVVEKSKEITTLEYLQEVQSSKLTGVNAGLEKLEDRFQAQMRIRPKRVLEVSRNLEEHLSKRFLDEEVLKGKFRGLTIQEIERLWDLPPLIEKKQSTEMSRLKLMARDVLLKTKSHAQLRKQIVAFLNHDGSSLRGAWGESRDTRLEALFSLSTRAYAERMERLMVVSKNLNFMRSMIHQGTRMVSELQSTITQCRNRSFQTITTKLIPDTAKVEAALSPKLRDLESTVTQRLLEAQLLSHRSAEELSKFFTYALILVGFCLAVGGLVTVLVTRAVSRPVQGLVSAAKRISQGDYESGVSLSGEGEFQLLAETFNEMSRRVKDSVGRLEHQLSVNSAISKAIAQTTQMLAHDVRKPFTMLHVGLNALKLIEKNPAEVKSLAQHLAEEVKKSLRSVDHLLADIMEIGGEAPLKLTDVSLVDMVTSALSEVFRYCEESQITFEYRWGHGHLLQTDRKKMLRVISNILENARQAISGEGRIWFETKEVILNEKAFVEICLGNSGPKIAKENLERIFDIFFTEGKQSGTGLGLAIAKKVVSAHEGGEIWATSEEATGTQFWCRLPMSPLLEMPFPQMVTHTKELKLIVPTIVNEQTPETSSEEIVSVETTKANRESLRQKISQKLRGRGTSMVLLLVEDEVFYADAILAQIEKEKNWSDEVHVFRARNAKEAFQINETHPVDLMICDLDLGEDSLNGFDLVRQLRALGSRAHICLHSNRSLPTDYRTASDVGADAFLPKPLNQTHLLQLVLAALERSEVEKENLSAGRSQVQEPREAQFQNDEIADFQVQDLNLIEHQVGPEDSPTDH